MRPEFKVSLLVCLALCSACTPNPRVEQPEQAPPIVAKQRVLSEDESDPLLRAALEEYKNDAAVRELVAEVRRNSSMPLTSGNRVGALIDGPQTYASIESELKAARHHIHLQTFIFGADATSTARIPVHRRAVPDRSVASRRAGATRTCE